MSHTYHFVCVECGDVVDVGKIVDTTDGGSQVPLQFAGWRDQCTSEWLTGPDLWVVLERWHIQHRGHEVRLVPEPYLDRVDPEGQLNYHDSAGDILDCAVRPLPDDEEDARALAQDLTDRILSIVRRKRTSNDSL